MQKTTAESITNYIKAGYGGLYLVTSEEPRVKFELKAVAAKAKYEIFTWSITKGVCDTATDPPVCLNDESRDPLVALDQFEKLPPKSILLLQDYHMFLADPNPLVFRRLKECIASGRNSNRVIIVLGCQLKLPPELEKEITVVDFKLPDKETLRNILQETVKDASIELNGHVDAILDAASGLTVQEAADAFSLSYVEHKDIVPESVANQKAQCVKKAGLLEIVDTNIRLEDIGGLDELKDWITKRSTAFGQEARDYGLPMPRGCLVVGIPGGGKTMFAKATAKILNVPLLKLDGGKLFGSLVGQSEGNMRTVINTLEAVAPCVCLLDEADKSFSGSKSSGQTDGGTSARVLGTFLQWMNDKTSPVFVVATANDVSQLPPELLRKGRWDELFFADLPTEEERQDIWRIHIQKKGRKAKDYDLETLARATVDWTGAEIEALYTEGMYAAFHAGKEPTTKLLVELSRDTAPLSKTMATQIQSLRDWATGKARRATRLKAQPATAGRKLTT